MVSPAGKSSKAFYSIDGFKILTHDWRSPTQGGPPLLNEATQLPVTLPAVELDTSIYESGSGYHYCGTLLEAARVSGFWPYGRSARCLKVIASEDAIERGPTRRASVLTLAALCSRDEIRLAMRENVWWASDPAAIELLVDEQWAWYLALGRPCCDESRVIEGLQAALENWGLNWTLKLFESPDTLWAAASKEPWHEHSPTGLESMWERLEDWVDSNDGEEGWWDLEDALRPWEAQWDRCQRWEAYVAKGAKSALTVQASSILSGVTDFRWDRLTVGIRDAYYYGLAVAVPTGRNELGYAMADEPSLAVGR